MAQPLLELRDLNIAFNTDRGQVRPVRDVSYTIFPGQTLAVVGESGCGKSVTALSILRLIPSPPGKVLGGSVTFGGRDLLALSEKDMRTVRGRDIAMIFQEPMTSLNPVYTIGDQIVEAVMLHQQVRTREAYEIAEQAMRDVGISDPKRRLHEYPHQMSGGMRQRVMIAMALSCKPKLLIADEPTTALDVTIQAQILELLRKLQREQGMAILLITHDLGVVAENADVVGVMYASRVVEYATVEQVFDRPLHPYTRGLLASVPKLGAHSERLVSIPGAVPNPARFPNGCKFHPRCPLTREAAARVAAGDATKAEVQGLNYEGSKVAPQGVASPLVQVTTPEETFTVLRKCAEVEPLLREVSPGHWAACHLVEDFDAAPVTRPNLENKREVVPRAVGSVTT
jgi:oligopeptide/dipeptide ABC transporter ATP-binding protein